MKIKMGAERKAERLERQERDEIRQLHREETWKRVRDLEAQDLESFIRSHPGVFACQLDELGWIPDELLARARQAAS